MSEVESETKKKKVLEDEEKTLSFYESFSSFMSRMQEGIFPYLIMMMIIIYPYLFVPFTFFPTFFLYHMESERRNEAGINTSKKTLRLIFISLIIAIAVRLAFYAGFFITAIQRF
ncbi:hypothetical protein JK635_07755 [Neobacillus sp. YIM B02564]|uniref:Uncharacterized protein n=1 Tax=Neobacillus paridis TaxID=2803862 RepID=A0ABS1TLB4_9BACI|nr:hypothetical protein [Neobacillus paridis]MBL4952104.1 hypothetical protein [Neobacillus paridis]